MSHFFFVSSGISSLCRCVVISHNHFDITSVFSLTHCFSGSLASSDLKTQTGVTSLWAHLEELVLSDDVIVLSDRWSLLSAIGCVLLVSVERLWWFPLFTPGMVWCFSVRRPCSRREGSETSIYLLEPVSPHSSQYISVFSSAREKFLET